MSAVFDIYNAVNGYLRLCIVIVHRRSCKRAKHVYLSHCCGSFLHKSKLCGCKISYLRKYFLLKSNYLIACTEDSVLCDFKLVGNKSLAVGKGLFSYIVVRHKVIVRLCYLDIISENSVIAYLQIFDTRFFSFTLRDIINYTLAS